MWTWQSCSDLHQNNQSKLSWTRPNWTWTCHVEHPVVSMIELYSKNQILTAKTRYTFVWSCQAGKNMMNRTCGFAWLNDVQLLSLRVYSVFVAIFFDNNGWMWSYFQRTVNLNCYTSCSLTTLKYIQVSLLQYCPLKIYTKLTAEMWGVYTLLWDTVCVYIYIYRCWSYN